jgi:hypothetical protein
MLGFGAITDFAVSDIGPEDLDGAATFNAAVTLSVTGQTDNPWVCQPSDSTAWACQ